MITLTGFPNYRQSDMMDCGPTCLQMISKFYGRLFNIEKLRKLTDIGKSGVSLLGITKAAEAIGIKAIGGKVPFETIAQKGALPCIVHWKRNHFLIVYKVTFNYVYISDPASGLVKYSRKEFLDNWTYTSANGNPVGVALFLEPTPTFYQLEAKEEKHNISFSVHYLLEHLWHYKKLLLQLLFGLIAGSLIQLIFPVLSKGLIDIGIKNKSYEVIYLILLGQITLSLGQFVIELIRGWVLLHITSRINITMISDFLHKLMKLPLSFFDTRLTGDLLQRIDDHRRVEALLTGNSLNTLFSLFNLFAFSGVIFYYSPSIFVVFLIGSCAYFTWMLAFLKKRKHLDFKRFETLAQNQSKILQIINGINEIKINDNGTTKIWEWEKIQARHFKLSTKNLKLEQYQKMGAMFISQTKDIIIIFLSAKGVLDHTFTMGEMLSIQFVIGQMNSPLAQMVSFLQVAQDAKLSMERIAQIHETDNEELTTSDYQYELPVVKHLTFDRVSFSYPGAANQKILNNVNFYIPDGKITAIVGSSGSGKTTLLKLLLRIYNPSEGQILIGDTENFDTISPMFWRSNCGSVLQDGYIFSDTIINNIVLNHHNIDAERLKTALEVANLTDFVISLPLGLHTRIGVDGKGISGGQKQRILIARVIYKNPKYIFLDEATSALDANNEKIIVEKLNHFYQGKTVVVIAHRLSTVKNADNIIVLHNGEITEQGSHQALVTNRSFYYELIKNQLELGA